jgi:hypothetical protein
MSPQTEQIIREIQQLPPAERQRISDWLEEHKPLASEASSREDIIEEIWERQRKRGHTPPSRTEVDAHIKHERDSWD